MSKSTRNEPNLRNPESPFPAHVTDHPSWRKAWALVYRLTAERLAAEDASQTAQIDPHDANLIQMNADTSTECRTAKSA